MNSGATRPEILDAVRDLEQRLDGRRSVEEEVAAALTRARADAAGVVAEAKAEAEIAAAQLRRDIDLAADREAERVLADARAQAKRLAAHAEADREAAVEAVLRLLTPPPRGAV
ncbi:vacuolar-type H+-ATPase subunit H [Microbacterium sp. AK009]|uniref:hypothetical protein n=1 Tax=Microbacterium sp. AK009 TaxID=2723068 RepID=UPI0015CDF0B0|nr:hypothetical protein [Microbacterium sp. AK009]NYF16572.1 vacuolar-type H+-ATPase subunit H [Microbacterium sp. AK009]